ncbi:TIGR04104 family putative zinc finger protein [Virgibacillus ihumii]|uniref:TIGR04104 family putative zinc finger protein n=1 Tax=Virgibacillus ihumii TaxID=2686091 RepID=UPI00157C454F
MILQKCVGCDYHFKWRTLYKGLMIGYKPIQCHRCGTKHKVTFSTRLRVACLTTVPLILLAYFMVPEVFIMSVPFSLISISLVITAIFLTLLTPLVARYNSCDS